MIGHSHRVHTLHSIYLIINYLPTEFFTRRAEQWLAVAVAVAVLQITNIPGAPGLLAAEAKMLRFGDLAADIYNRVPRHPQRRSWKTGGPSRSCDTQARDSIHISGRIKSCGQNKIYRQPTVSIYPARC